MSLLRYLPLLTAVAAGLAGTAPAPAATVFAPPKFVIGVWLQPAASLAGWRARGVNTAFGYEPQGGAVSNADWSSAAAAASMAYIRAPGASLAADAADRHLLAFLQPDEPEYQGIAPSTLVASYRSWKAAAPAKPVITNFVAANVEFNTTSQATYQQYLQGTDWVSSDIYPIFSFGRPDWIYRVGLALDELRAYSNGKPQYAFIEANAQRDGSGVTPAQFRAEAWGAVVHGARGIIYFPQAFDGGFRYDSTTPALVAELTTLDSHLTDIAATLAGPLNPAALAVSVDAPLETAWRASGSGRLVIVLNQTDQTVTAAKIRIGGTSGGVAKVWWENRTVVASGGVMTDTFAPYSVHVYQLVTR